MSYRLIVEGLYLCFLSGEFSKLAQYQSRGQQTLHRIGRFAAFKKLGFVCLAS
jgi:hypothetical protein